MSEWLKPDILMQAIAMFLGIVSAAFVAYYAIKGDLLVIHARMDGIREQQNGTNKRVDVVEGDVKMLMYGGDRRNSLPVKS